MSPNTEPTHFIQYAVAGIRGNPSLLPVSVNTVFVARGCSCCVEEYLLVLAIAGYTQQLRFSGGCFLPLLTYKKKKMKSTFCPTQQNAPNPRCYRSSTPYRPCVVTEAENQLIHFQCVGEHGSHRRWAQLLSQIGGCGVAHSCNKTANRVSSIRGDEKTPRKNMMHC